MRLFLVLPQQSCLSIPEGRGTLNTYPMKARIRQMSHARDPTSYWVLVTMEAPQEGQVHRTGISRNRVTRGATGWEITTSAIGKTGALYRYISKQSHQGSDRLGNHNICNRKDRCTVQVYLETKSPGERPVGKSQHLQ